MLKLTSVKLLDNLYKKFKISNLDDNFTLQKLINRSMDLYPPSPPHPLRSCACPRSVQGKASQG